MNPGMVRQPESAIRGVYIARLDLSVPNHIGVHNKILGQMAALENALGPIDGYFPHDLAIEKNGHPVSRFSNGPAAHFRFHQYGFYTALNHMNLQADYFYIRHQLATPAFLVFLRQLRRKNPGAMILLEVPSYPYDLEANGVNQKLKFLQDRVCRRYMASAIDRIVTFSQQDSIFDVSTVQTQNGIAIDKFTPIAPPQLSNRLNLVGIANVSHWHGYDRVIEGLRRYYSTNPDHDIHFTIIGDGAEIPNLKTLVADNHLEARVHFAGSMTGTALSDALGTMHIAVSSLGMHRLNTDTTNLKSREYCARGIPFLNSHKEADIPADFPYAFTVPADDSPVDLSDLFGRYARLRDECPDFPVQMRNYAADHLTWASKFAPVVDAITSHTATRKQL